jgi:hypothetical protein
MKLKHLTALISEKVNESELTKSEMAEALSLSLSTFCYRCENGLLEWAEIAKLKKLGVHITLKEFSDAMSKDLNHPVVIRRPRA